MKTKEEIIKEFESKSYKGGFHYKNGALSIPKQLKWLSQAIDQAEKNEREKVIEVLREVIADGYTPAGLPHALKGRLKHHDKKQG